VYGGQPSGQRIDQPGEIRSRRCLETPVKRRRPEIAGRSRIRRSAADRAAR
jgi:hypothetical protein